MNWRTDKPTADVIVAEVKDRGYKIMYASNYDTFHYLDDNGEEYEYTEFVKWADLEEEEVVTDCHQLENSEILTEEVKRLGWSESVEDCNDFHLTCGDGAATINDVFDLASHFAKWGAEHLIGGNKVIGDRYKKVGEDVEEAARNSWFNYEFDCGALYSKCYKDGFKAGANWQNEQDHDACYQCEKAYDNVFYRGAQHAIKMLKEEATVATVYEDAGGYPFVPAIEMYDYDNDEPTAKKGDKVKVIILKDE